MYWFYVDKAMIPLTFKITVDGMVKGLDSCKKDSANVFLLNQKTPTVKLTCQVNGVAHYQLISCGVVNNQAVITMLTLLKNPKTNDDLPPSIRQIVRLR
jgi:hypothetical protein